MKLRWRRSVQKWFFIASAVSSITLFRIRKSVSFSLILANNQLKHAMEITLKQAQQTVDEWIKTVGVRYFNELTNLGILMEEVGELSRLIVRKYGEQSSKESDKANELSDEIADVLFVLICLANQTNVDLTEAFNRNIAKKNSRDSQRHKSNEKLK